ncbi:MAG TPA: LLM class flavin-dependent oxidoreductase [Acidimicrobiia bacterium]|nr:LLM class flavin-dependent oxidoreductase [Acidimicrobiia bacterium]
MTIRVGITLPSFRDDPDPTIAIARAADDAGLDGVFLFDHIFRAARTGDRPALELAAVLGAVAAETSRVAIGSLVARATLRPPAVLANVFASARRIAGERVIAGIGAGDSESRGENESFGLRFGTLDERLAALEAAVLAVRAAGVPVWVGGAHRRLVPIVALADGWNRWGADTERFATEAARVRAMAPDAALTWGGLVVLGADDATAREKAERLGASPGTIVGAPATVAAALAPYVDAGASWVVLGPVDSSDPGNVALACEVREQLRG